MIYPTSHRFIPSGSVAPVANYSDNPNTSGETLLPADLLKDIVRRADREGIDIHVHSFGDRATRLTLDAIEAAIASNPPRDRHHAMAHLVLVDAQDVPRFGALGVLAQFSAQWSVPDRYWTNISKQRLGPARSAQIYRIGSILRNGGTLSFGTDWPAAGHYSTFRPLEAIEVAITRRELGRREQTPLPPRNEQISLDEALWANTMGAAYQARLDHKVDSIEVGKLADLIVLDRNLFEIPPHEIHKTKVVMTVMNGKVWHEQPS